MDGDYAARRARYIQLDQATQEFLEDLETLWQEACRRVPPLVQRVNLLVADPPELRRVTAELQDVAACGDSLGRVHGAVSARRNAYRVRFGHVAVAEREGRQPDATQVQHLMRHEVGLRDAIRDGTRVVAEIRDRMGVRARGAGLRRVE